MDGHLERVGASQRESDKAKRAATVCWAGSAVLSVLAQELQRARNVAAPPFYLLIQRRAQYFRFLDRRSRLATVEVGGERDEARLREPVADLAKRLRQSPPGKQRDDS